jgi:hypothetical protein
LFPWMIVIHVKSIPSTITPVIVLVVEALRVHVVEVVLIVPFVQRFEYVSQVVDEGRFGHIVRRLGFVFSITSFAVPWRRATVHRLVGAKSEQTPVAYPTYLRTSGCSLIRSLLPLSFIIPIDGNLNGYVKGIEIMWLEIGNEKAGHISKSHQGLDAGCVVVKCNANTWVQGSTMQVFIPQSLVRSQPFFRH